MKVWTSFVLFLSSLSLVSGVTQLNKDSFRSALQDKETLVTFFYRNVRDKGKKFRCTPSQRYVRSHEKVFRAYVIRVLCS